jgi:hypothetical protein
MIGLPAWASRSAMKGPRYTAVKIENACGKLPLGALWHVRRSLRWIDPADIAGVGFIELQNRMPKATAEAPDWHKNATAEDLSVNGLYKCKESGSPAKITLFIRDLYRGMPAVYWLTPALTIRVARTLAHEVGHHLIAKRGYVFTLGEKVQPIEYEEEMAHRYSFSVIKRMRHHWYYRLGTWATKTLAVWHYGQAVVDWKAGYYERAAESWYRSFHLDPDRQEAIHWYQRARQAAGKKCGETRETRD